MKLTDAYLIELISRPDSYYSGKQVSSPSFVKSGQTRGSAVEILDEDSAKVVNKSVVRAAKLLLGWKVPRSVLTLRNWRDAELI